jgi:hypothetical protein
MEPVIYRLLLEGAQNSNQVEGVDRLMKYLDSNLIKIKNRTTPSGFDKLFAIIWDNTAIALKELVRTNIEVSPNGSLLQYLCGFGILMIVFAHRNVVHQLSSSKFTTCYKS